MPETAPATPVATGERVVPGHVAPDLYYEHVTRYQFAAPLCRGRTVLDAGCGAGYGARLLAREATSVVAVDQSEDVLRYAGSHFADPRLRYVAGDCGRLPFRDGAFDRVVAFEVIEHLPDAARFLREVRRVLSPAGLLVVSTPNKRQYVDARPGYQNPFHVREYYFAEWADLLASVFPSVRHFDQQYAQALSFVERTRDGRPARPGLPPPEVAHDDGNGGAARYEDRGHEAAQFFVAVCAADASSLPDLPPRQFLLSTGDVLAERTRWVRLLQDEVEAGKARITEANQMLNNVHRELDERTAWAQAAAGEVAERDERIRRLEAELARVRAQASAAGEPGGAQLRALSEQVGALAARHEEMMEAMEDLHRGFIHLKGAEAVAEDLRYRQLVRRLRKTLDALLPPDATVLVASKGDEPLLELGGRRGWHFPQDHEGHYAGFNPADSGSAVVHLEALRARGAQYFVLPAPSLWWLGHYKGLARHLERHYRLLLRQDEVCAVYALTEPPAAGAAGAAAAMAEVVAEFERRFERRPAVLDWDTGLRLAAALPELMTFSPPGGGGGRLPYLDKTVDVVAVATADPAALAEARRVATGAVVGFAPGPDDAAAAPRVQWLGEPTAPPPASVSIVIPSYNGAALTDACLRALAETLPADFRGEVVVVDDCSTDDTPARLADWPRREPRMNVKLLRNPQNSGFLVTCNNGAAAATGDYVILMNNDTLPQRGWLEPLLRTFRDHPDAGAVGCKLVYPDGRLQEAGGVVFDDGSAANFGKFEYQLDLPLYNYVREVDYVTGALIMTPRALFDRLGGLDTRYRPIYYEETDYCFRLREQGYKVYYQPQSVVIHLEGVTCGTDTGSGQKRYQVVNREKFVERWRDALRRQPPGPGKFNRAAWHRLAVRGGCIADTGDEAKAAGANGRARP